MGIGGLQGLGFLRPVGVGGSAVFLMEVGWWREGDSRGLWRTEHPDHGPKHLQLG